MAIIITDECINCGACETECPNNAIYKGESSWTISEGTNVTSTYTLNNGQIVDAYAEQTPLSNEVYFIVPEKCTECKGFHDEPQCASVCPVDCCITDVSIPEGTDDLFDRKKRLHGDS